MFDTKTTCRLTVGRNVALNLTLSLVIREIASEIRKRGTRRKGNQRRLEPLLRYNQ